MIFIGLILITLILTAFGTWLLQRHIVNCGILDVPNARSLHVVPTPRGGGLAVVVVTVSMFLALWLLELIDELLFLALAGGGAIVAIVGFMDDRRSLRASVRILVHFFCAILAIRALNGIPGIQYGSMVVDLGIMGDIAGVVAIVWMLNLFNFMDGIDGITASESAFIAGSGALLGLVAGGSTSISIAASIVVAASFGFLVWNWPPARIFMGDVGSGYLGYTIAILALAAAHENPAMLFVWLILAGVFVVDTTFTLVRRLARGERVYEAHRTHAYQWLARRWGSHQRVTLAVMLVNVVWLLPCAWLVTVYPTCAGWIALGALLPIVFLAIAAGAGRPEGPVQARSVND